MLCVGEWLGGDVREVKDPEYALSPVVGYIAFARKGVVSIPTLPRTPAKVVRTEAEAMEYIAEVHRRRLSKHADGI